MKRFGPLRSVAELLEWKYIYIYISRRSDETRGLMHSGYFRMGDIMGGKLEEERIFFPFWFEYIYLK